MNLGNDHVPDFAVTIVDDIARTGQSCYEMEIEGTFKNEFLQIRPTNKEFKTHGVEIFHFENGKIKEAWTVFDMTTPS